MGSKALDPKTLVVHALPSSEGTAQGTHSGMEAPHNREVLQRRRLRRHRRLDLRLAGASVLARRLDSALGVLRCSHCFSRCINKLSIDNFVLQVFNIRMALG